MKKCKLLKDSSWAAEEAKASYNGILYESLVLLYVEWFPQFWWRAFILQKDLFLLILRNPKNLKDEVQIFNLFCSEKSLIHFIGRAKTTIDFLLSFGSGGMVCPRFLKNPRKKVSVRCEVCHSFYRIDKEGTACVPAKQIIREVAEVLSGEKLTLVLCCNTSRPYQSGHEHYLFFHKQHHHWIFPTSSGSWSAQHLRKLSS